MGAVAEIALLGASGVAAGVASSAGAIGSLISYPALLIAGLSPFVANVTQSVSVVGIGVGATLSSRVELRSRGRTVLRLSALMCAGTAAGVALLLLAPARAFEWVVPFLVATASVVLLAQPRIARRWSGRGDGMAARLGAPALAAAALYNGYFGAASGVMTLTVLLLAVEGKLAHANALKNALLGVSDVTAATGMVLFGPVDWSAAVPLGIGFLLGATLGPRVTRRAPAQVLRLVIAAAGFALAAWLLADVALG